jgi:acetyl-CoA carboxylase carboxyl transferase subunit beta
MNWITNFVRPKIKGLWGEKQPDTPDNLWRKCPACGGMIFHRDLAQTLYVCQSCQHHMRLPAPERLGLLFDGRAFEEITLPDAPLDPLKFRDPKKYTDRLKEARAKTGRQDCLTAAQGAITGIRTTVAVQDFDFMGGSLGMATGEGIVAAMTAAVRDRTPFVMVTASGGARMQEGILSLMQMPRTTIAVQMLKDARLPYIVVHTDPTTGGVTASYAMLGDVHIAEPGALIGLSGPRVIENTIRAKLPDGFQRSEYLLDHGMVDIVCHRKDLKATVGRVLRHLTRSKAASVPAADLVPANTDDRADGGAPVLQAAQEAHHGPSRGGATHPQETA